MTPKTMRSKDIEEHKKKLSLSSKQRSIIVGKLLGDGHLETMNQGRTYRLKIEHSIKQMEYVDWLYSQFKELVPGEVYTKTRQSNGKNYTSYGFTTYSLGSLRFYGKQFYKDKTRVVPKMINSFLDPLALAVWFMDDGSYKSAKHKTYIIHAVGYTRSELELLSKILQSKFGLDVRVHRQYDKYRLYVASSSAQKFKELIERYIIPSMKYKLGNKLPKE